MSYPMAPVALILIALMLVAGPATAQSLAFVDVTVIDVVGGAAEPGQTVVLAGDRIAAVGAADGVVIPTGATVIDGRGKFLIPGLWDMHVHMANDVWAPAPWDFHSAGPEEADQREIYLPIYLAFGVTGIREMSGGVVSLQMRELIERGELLGPHTVVGSPLLDGPEPLLPDVAVIPIVGAELVREVVTKLEADGFDFLKPYSYLSAESYRALHEHAAEMGMEVAGHVPLGVNIWEAAELGQRTVEHLIGVEFGCSRREDELRQAYLSRLGALNADSSFEDRMGLFVRSEWEPLEDLDPASCDALFAHLAAHETWVVPTLVYQRKISYPDDPVVADDPNFRYLHPDDRDPRGPADEYGPERPLRPIYDHRTRVIPQLHRAGVGILAGADTPGGFALHQELEIFVESGLAPLDALRTATINPARYLGRQDDLGSIENGKIADLVLLGANPLEDIRKSVALRAGVVCAVCGTVRNRREN